MTATTQKVQPPLEVTAQEFDKAVALLRVSVEHPSAREEIRRSYVTSLYYNANNKKALARGLNISRGTLYRKLREYNVPDNIDALISYLSPE